MCHTPKLWFDYWSERHESVSRWERAEIDAPANFTTHADAMGDVLTMGGKA